MTNPRLAKLQSMLTKSPADPFLWYALGLEHKKLGDYPQALSHLRTTLEKDPDYVVAYQQIGQTCELAGDPAAARSAYQEGIAAARNKGDHHAAEEMEGALRAIE